MVVNINGGKLIGTGSYGCVFKPKLKCLKKKSNKSKKTKNKSKNKKKTHKKSSENISKLFFRDTNLEKELESGKSIINIKNYDKWAAIYTSTCDSGSYNTIKKYESDIKKCKGLDKHNNDNDNMISLHGNYGGIPISIYIIDNIMKHYEENNKQFIENYHKFLCLFKNIFKGLSDMNKHNICHLDIKYDNMVISKGTIKLIDFGISNNSITGLNSIKRRARREFHTTRYYPPYPPELIYSGNTSKKELEEELYMINTYGIDRHHGNFIKSLHIDYFKDKKSLKKYINNMIQRNIDNPISKNELKKLYDKIDIYSLGIVLIYILKHINESNNIINTKVKKIFAHPKIKPFINLVKRMIKLNYYERISAEDAYKEYCKILKQFK